jgi:hypothetical protein
MEKKGTAELTRRVCKWRVTRLLSVSNFLVFFAAFIVFILAGAASTPSASARRATHVVFIFATDRKEQRDTHRDFEEEEKEEEKDYVRVEETARVNTARGATSD